MGKSERNGNSETHLVGGQDSFTSLQKTRQIRSLIR